MFHQVFICKSTQGVDDSLMVPEGLTLGLEENNVNPNITQIIPKQENISSEETKMGFIQPEEIKMAIDEARTEKVTVINNQIAMKTDTHIKLDLETQNSFNVIPSYDNKILPVSQGGQTFLQAVPAPVINPLQTIITSSSGQMIVQQPQPAVINSFGSPCVFQTAPGGNLMLQPQLLNMNGNAVQLVPLQTGVGNASLIQQPAQNIPNLTMKNEAITSVNCVAEKGTSATEIKSENIEIKTEEEPMDLFSEPGESEDVKVQNGAEKLQEGNGNNLDIQLKIQRLETEPNEIVDLLLTKAYAVPRIDNNQSKTESQKLFEDTRTKTHDDELRAMYNIEECIVLVSKSDLGLRKVKSVQDRYSGKPINPVLNKEASLSTECADVAMSCESDWGDTTILKKDTCFSVTDVAQSKILDSQWIQKKNELCSKSSSEPENNDVMFRSMKKIINSDNHLVSEDLLPESTQDDYLGNTVRPVLNKESNLSSTDEDCPDVDISSESDWEEEYFGKHRSKDTTMSKNEIHFSAKEVVQSNSLECQSIQKNTKPRSHSTSSFKNKKSISKKPSGNKCAIKKKPAGNLDNIVDKIISGTSEHFLKKFVSSPNSFITITKIDNLSSSTKCLSDDNINPLFQSQICDSQDKCNSTSSEGNLTNTLSLKVKKLLSSSETTRHSENIHSSSTLPVSHRKKRPNKHPLTSDETSIMDLSKLNTVKTFVKHNLPLKKVQTTKIANVNSNLHDNITTSEFQTDCDVRNQIQTVNFIKSQSSDDTNKTNDKNKAFDSLLGSKQKDHSLSSAAADISISKENPNKSTNYENSSNNDEALPEDSYLNYCMKCDKYFKTLDLYKYHLRYSVCHGHRREAIHKCNFCDKRFPSREKKENHENSHTNARPFKCSDCDKCFNSKAARQTHHKKMHLNIKRARLLCCFCAYTTKNQEDLSAHEQTHKLPEGAEIPKPFICLQCGKGYISQWKLNSHKKEHKMKKCDQCSEQFKSVTQLRNHKKAAHNIFQTYICEKCGKQFKHPETLRQHEACHSASLSFFCDICDKGFKRKNNLKQHMISHSDERPICCPECGERFKRPTHLKQHVDACHGSGRK